MTRQIKLTEQMLQQCKTADKQNANYYAAIEALKAHSISFKVSHLHDEVLFLVADADVSKSKTLLQQVLGTNWVEQDE